jgi:hypothetical protein
MSQPNNSREIPRIILSMMTGAVCTFWLGAVGFHWLYPSERGWYDFPLSMTIFYVSAAIGLLIGRIAWKVTERFK